MFAPPNVNKEGAAPVSISIFLADEYSPAVLTANYKCASDL
jgi:hypothetical protein